MKEFKGDEAGWDLRLTDDFLLLSPLLLLHLAVPLLPVCVCGAVCLGVVQARVCLCVRECVWCVWCARGVWYARVQCVPYGGCV